jgi:vitamin B12 transporter
VYLNSSNDGLRQGHRGGLYLTTEYRPVKNLLLIASIKEAGDGKSFVPVPKIGAAWTVNSSLTLKNNYFRSFKFPDFDDLYWIQAGFMGNPDLKPEDGWGADLLAEWRHKEFLQLASSLYWEWTEDSIHWNNASGSWRPENISQGAFLGWDNKVNITLPHIPFFQGKPVLSLFWQFQRSWLINDGAGFSGNLRIPYMPQHVLGFTAELPWLTGDPRRQGSLSLSGRYESLRFADPGNLIKLDPAFLLNMTVNQKIGKTITAFGSLRNILNTRYVSFAGYPMPGLNFTLGLRMNYAIPPAAAQGE